MFITSPLPSWNAVASGSQILPNLALAGKELGDGCADAASLVRVNLGQLLDRRDRRLRIIFVLKESAAYDSGMGDKVAALRHRTVVAGRQDEIVATKAAIRAGRPKSVLVGGKTIE